MDIQIIGIYPVEAEEPCSLIEMKIAKTGEEEFDVSLFTQEIADQPEDNWQVPYDEQFLNTNGTKIFNPDDPAEIPDDDELRMVFYFHYLDLDKTFKAPIGNIPLPKPTKKPERLSFLEYESPY